MKRVRTVAELRAALVPPRRAGARIGLVPTMGAFHDGHLSLMRRARQDNDLVVVSLFVNPAQFNDDADLEAYPRDERRDFTLADGLGVDVVFAPHLDEIYPRGFATTVSVSGVSEPLEGEHRGRGHFDGVATVVTRLLHLARPDVAYFGRKDAQQLAVIRRLVLDLGLPVRIEAVDTVRADDGLALSSRNALLSAADRRRAPVLHRALEAVHDAVLQDERDPAAALAVGYELLTAAGVEPDYLTIVDPDTMLPVSVVEGGVLVLVAARLGSTRLIDSTLIPGFASPTARTDRVPGATFRADTNRQVATPLGAPTA